MDVPEEVTLLLANFNFERVSKMMKAVRWKWKDIKRPPEPDELIETAIHLFKCVLKDYNGSEDFTMSTGGLEATRYINNDKEVVFKLRFVGEEEEV